MADQLTHKRIQRVWEAMDGGSEGWRKTFGYQQFALAIIAEFLPQVDEEAIGRADSMGGTGGGYTMCVWKSSDVPVGTPLYLRPASPPVAVQEERDATKVLKDLRWRLDDIRDMLMKEGFNGERIYGCDEWSTPTVNLATAISVIDKSLAAMKGDQP